MEITDKRDCFLHLGLLVEMPMLSASDEKCKATLRIKFQSMIGSKHLENIILLLSFKNG